MVGTVLFRRGIRPAVAVREYHVMNLFAFLIIYRVVRSMREKNVFIFLRHMRCCFHFRPFYPISFIFASLSGILKSVPRSTISFAWLIDTSVHILLGLNFSVHTYIRKLFTDSEATRVSSNVPLFGKIITSKIRLISQLRKHERKMK